MNLNFETILDFYTHNNDKKILCQIKVTPSTNPNKINSTCRSLTQKQWNTFDKELEKLINTNDDWNDQKCLKFNINSSIEVKVQKSKLSVKDFHKCLGGIEDCEKEITDGIEDNYVLECLIVFQLEVPLNTPHESQEYEPQIKTTPDKLSSPLSYEPYTPSKKKYQTDTIETIKTPGIDLLECNDFNSSVSYEPYTPSKKKYRLDNIDTIKTPGIDLLESNEDTYSPKPIFPITGGEALLIEKIPKYTPAPIKNVHCSNKLKKSLDHDLLEKIIVETGEEIESLKSKLKKKSKKSEIEYIPKSQEFDVVDVPVYIPTPIGETTQTRKAFKGDYENKKHRKRSKTIDEFPGLLLDENTKGKYKTIKEYTNSNNKNYHYENKRIKKRSKTIDEIPAGFSDDVENIKNMPEVSNSKEKKTILRQNIYKTKEKLTMLEKIPETTTTASSASKVEMPFYVPTPTEVDINLTKAIKTDYYSRKHKKRSNTIDELPGHLHIENNKERIDYNNDLCDIKHLRKRSKTIDEIPSVLGVNDEKSIAKNSPEEKKEKLRQKLLLQDKTTPEKLKESKSYLNKTSPITNKTSQKCSKDKKSERKKIKDSPPCKENPNKTPKKSSKIFAEQNADKFENSVTINKNTNISTATKTISDTTPPKVLKRERTQEKISDIKKSLRRSERSPSKPNRLIEEHHNAVKSNKCKKLKTSPKNKELFGTDDEDDDDHFRNNRHVCLPDNV